MSEEDVFPTAIPDEIKGPSKAWEANWAGWQQANARERAVNEDNRRLTLEIRELDRRCERLHAEIQIAGNHRAIASLFVVLASISGGFLVNAASTDASENTLVVLVVVTVVFVAIGVLAPWLQRGSRPDQKD